MRTFGNGVAFELPSARKISTTMTSKENPVSGEHTVLFMQMGQVYKQNLTQLLMHTKGPSLNDVT